MGNMVSFIISNCQSLSKGFLLWKMQEVVKTVLVKWCLGYSGYEVQYQVRAKGFNTTQDASVQAKAETIKLKVNFDCWE